jgi:hypothetical protein
MAPVTAHVTMTGRAGGTLSPFRGKGDAILAASADGGLDLPGTGA